MISLAYEVYTDQHQNKNVNHAVSISCLPLHNQTHFLLSKLAGVESALDSTNDGVKFIMSLSILLKYKNFGSPNFQMIKMSNII